MIESEFSFRHPHVGIEWDSEGHLSGFRQSPAFRSFFEAVGPFVHDIEEMRHYQVTLSTALTKID